ncbi:MAG: DUF4093 domain-containing protein [Oscillospiraceae bacterium]|jgi:ribonuclease M5|nr:DUF4093 domain-containing protein [Oscillospiraceae bacterium]
MPERRGEKPKIREIIVVEGRYDKNTVAQAVDALILETGGFGAFRDGELIALLRRLGQARGVILLTDSDGAGFLIRGKLAGMLPGTAVKHAYIPDVPGRERRKRARSRAGLLGVEGMGREVLVQALRDAGATFAEENAAPARNPDVITKADMYALGLTGTPNAAARRETLLTELALPKLLSANALLAVLNALFTRETFFALAERVLKAAPTI